jgi:chemotaxis protein MotA
MKAATGIGIAVAVVGVLMSAMMDGTSPAAFMNPTALILIIAGTGGVTLASVGMDGMKKIPSLYKRVINAEPLDVQGRVNLLV